MKIRKIAAVAVTAALNGDHADRLQTTFNNFNEASSTAEKEQLTLPYRSGSMNRMSGADSDAAKAEIKGIELAHEVYPNIGGKIVELVDSDDIRRNIDAAEYGDQ